MGLQKHMTLKRAKLLKQPNRYNVIKVLLQSSTFHNMKHLILLYYIIERHTTSGIHCFHSKHKKEYLTQ